ncbi:phycobiliprotein lyase [Synechococcus sp. MU1617]|uniref:phycobiliprotein lyase n=1 Tax=Synechococcus sp. MU1617 TaxID=2508346 RepID=UPI001CF90115|nr:phycobiliprotein lyase [Synechococcus sp. MU1617]MCB4390138.1 phycobiliprotein lyase [Synechococcus sp. MU1617]
MSEQAFPPEDPGSFLSLCDGVWMSLRSCFELAAGGDDEWHSSERGELTVRWVKEQGALGQLQVQAPGGTSSTLTFAADGQLILDADSQGNWRFWPDGSMELNLSRADGVQVQERIWFTRVNLRLRSTTAVDAQGTPVQGSFCTDIRRVSKPAA